MLAHLHEGSTSTKRNKNAVFVVMHWHMFKTTVKTPEPSRLNLLRETKAESLRAAMGKSHRRGRLAQASAALTNLLCVKFVNFHSEHVCKNTFWCLVVIRSSSRSLFKRVRNICDKNKFSTKHCGVSCSYLLNGPAGRQVNEPPTTRLSQYNKTPTTYITWRVAVHLWPFGEFGVIAPSQAVVTRGEHTWIKH